MGNRWLQRLLKDQNIKSEIEDNSAHWLAWSFSGSRRIKGKRTGKSGCNSPMKARTCN